MVTYVASELSSTTNGAALRVDGGVGEGDSLVMMSAVESGALFHVVLHLCTSNCASRFRFCEYGG